MGKGGYEPIEYSDESLKRMKERAAPPTPPPTQVDDGSQSESRKLVEQQATAAAAAASVPTLADTAREPTPAESKTAEMKAAESKPAAPNQAGGAAATVAGTDKSAPPRPGRLSALGKAICVLVITLFLLLFSLFAFMYFHLRSETSNP